MNGLKRIITDEPVLIVGLVQAGIAMLVAFGLDWTPEQIGMVLAFTATMLSVVARAMVTPTANVAEQVDAQVRAERRDLMAPLTPEEAATLSVLRDQRDRLEEELRLRRAQEAADEREAARRERASIQRVNMDG